MRCIVERGCGKIGGITTDFLFEQPQGFSLPHVSEQSYPASYFSDQAQKKENSSEIFEHSTMRDAGFEQRLCA
jgi:hypothetical protein